MIYSTIIQWLNGKFSAFNESLADPDKLKQIEVNLDSGFLPANLKDRKYIIKFTGFREEGIETEQYSVNAEIEFQFTLYKKPLEHYRHIIDDYLFRFVRLLQDDTTGGLEFTANGITLTNLRSPAVTKLDKTDREGKFLMPVISFDIEAVTNN